MNKTRFAPSPTGLLHLGNIYSALQCKSWAKANKAECILRVEDIDFTRCKSEFIVQMLDDLSWMDINFDGEVTYQSRHSDLYRKALDKLIALGVLYPCFCTRKQVAENTRKPNRNQLDDYPQTCLRLSTQEVAMRQRREPFSWRLNAKKVQNILGASLCWLDGQQLQHSFTMVDDIGDVILGRKDIHYSYHLAVVVDDAEQMITHVIRGEDLRSSTPVHHVLQLLLEYASPLYIHHPLIQGKQGERLAKSKGSPTLKSLRDEGLSMKEVLSLIKKASLS